MEFYKFRCNAKNSAWGFKSITVMDIARKIDENTFSGTSHDFTGLNLKGRSAIDIICNRFTYFINDRVKDLFTNNCFKGWSYFPIQITKEIGTNFYGLAINGTASIAFCKSDQQHGITIGFDINSWDGSDFFKLGDSRSFLVTQNVADCIATEKVTGIELIKINPNGTLLS